MCHKPSPTCSPNSHVIVTITTRKKNNSPNTADSKDLELEVRTASKPTTPMRITIKAKAPKHHKRSQEVKAEEERRVHRGRTRHLRDSAVVDELDNEVEQDDEVGNRAATAVASSATAISAISIGWKASNTNALQQ